MKQRKKGYIICGSALSIILIFIFTGIIGSINYEVNMGGNYEAVRKSMTVDECIENLDKFIEKINNTFDDDDYCDFIVRSYDKRVEFQKKIPLQMKERLIELQEWYITVNKSITLYDQYNAKYKDLKKIYLEDDEWNDIKSNLYQAYMIKYYIPIQIMWLLFVPLLVIILLTATIGMHKWTKIDANMEFKKKCPEYDNDDEGYCSGKWCRNKYGYSYRRHCKRY